MNIEKAREQIFSKDETNGYIERETAIHLFLQTEQSEEQAERYVAALEFMLGYLSTPIDPDDLILGRMVEGPIPYEMEPVIGTGRSHVGNPFKPNDGRITGHLNLDYEDLLKRGLSGIVSSMEARAESSTQKRYASLARRAIEAVKSFAFRYAEAAEAKGKTRAAEALRIVPYAPAYDFFSALQSIWMMQLILSCAAGGRDFGYSRLDLTLWPYHRAEQQDDELQILEAFLLKNNEIGGMNSDIGDIMPVPCSSTNMYAMLGGKGAEQVMPLSLLILQAAERVHLPQPILAIRVSKGSADKWKLAAAEAAQTLSGQVSFYNDDALIPNLIRLGYTEEHALNYTMSGCNRVDFPGHMSSDNYHNCPARLLDAFYDPSVTDMDSLTEAFRREMRKDMEHATGHRIADPETDLRFFLESLLLRGCPEQVKDLENGGQIDQTMVHHLCGVATVANSFAAVEKAVFTDHLMTLDTFRTLVKDDFKSDPDLWHLIRNRYPKFGNDDERADRWAEIAGRIMTDAAREMTEKTDRIHIPCLYSLHFHQNLGRDTGATPDGRLSGEAISENQSPVYGTDHEGVTALLHSVSRLPQAELGCGGFNLRLQKKLENETAVGLLDACLELGLCNVTLDVMSRETLIAARNDPEKYKTLCVRIVGFSEVFVRLPDALQQELIDRTAYAV